MTVSLRSLRCGLRGVEPFPIHMYPVYIFVYRYREPSGAIFSTQNVTDAKAVYP